MQADICGARIDPNGREKNEFKEGKKGQLAGLGQRLGNEPDMKLEKVAGADSAGLVGLHGSYLFIVFESLCKSRANQLSTPVSRAHRWVYKQKATRQKTAGPKRQ